jgi:SAM-dependent methyltransferase
MLDYKTYWDERHRTGLNGTKLPEWADYVLEQLLGQSNFAHCLDFGCGKGRWTPKLTKYVCHYTGCDVSPIALEQAKIRNPGRSFINPKYLINKSFCYLLFGCIVCVHLADKDVKRMAQLLMPGGTALFIESYTTEKYLPRLSQDYVMYRTKEQLLSLLPWSLDQWIVLNETTKITQCAFLFKN